MNTHTPQHVCIELGPQSNYGMRISSLCESKQFKYVLENKSLKKPDVTQKLSERQTLIQLSASSSPIHLELCAPLLSLFLCHT